MKTYSETQGKEQFDWNKALNASKKDWDDLYEKADEWVTCACGNQCSIVPRWPNGTPIDSELKFLGLDFADSIEQHDTEKAKEILNKIEIRSAELINELTNKL